MKIEILTVCDNPEAFLKKCAYLRALLISLTCIAWFLVGISIGSGDGLYAVAGILLFVTVATLDSGYRWIWY